MHIFDDKKYNILAVKNHKKYINAKSFSHIQFKNFLDKKIANDLYKSFPS